ncbi:MAG: hypothetical protein ACOX2L_01390 [Anaerolineae bacterium]|jgi:hypothetical protein|nr:hypothetical protein [Chloroflexota bacterium]
MDPFLEQLAGHLAFLGYQAEPNESGEVLRMSHPSRADFTMRMYLGGCLMTAWYGTRPQALVEREAFLEAINALNARAAVVRYYVDDEFDFAAEMLYLPPYDRVGFGSVMDLWHRDFSQMFESGLNQYLS